jgi:hypothetical protein
MTGEQQHQHSEGAVSDPVVPSTGAADAEWEARLKALRQLANTDAVSALEQAQQAHRRFKRPPKPDDQTAASQDGTSAAVRSWLRRPFGPSRRFPWGSSGLDLRSRS